ncbi:sigma-E factor negative regulatory protein RseC [uncultured Gammaproteobacteria bacterium]
MDDDGLERVEGHARVVAIEHGVAWLEPEPDPGCGGCASAVMCGSKSGGQGQRLAARRFALNDAPPLRLGERVVVGIPQGALLRAATIAYGLPLLTMLAGGVTVQAMGGGDVAAMVGTGCGLAVGLVAARFGAGRMSAKGELSPRFIRRLVVCSVPNEVGPGQSPGRRRQA